MESDFSNEDVLDFAKHLGLEGIDGDLFYESYYQLNSDEYEYDYVETNEVY